ncbi:MAG: GNAT family N-acetyltransferase [Defluviitaleaceae bacterium]|nr:GNAT family N-acetyltransferase [Defluviitaleaceae bacterium]MCL2240173.1 GNAT family N-acetyltransferase [Defluviitaleaceae bacterium]
MQNESIKLRYIKENDIADYVTWTTTETEWCDWDAPWEEDEDDFLEMQQKLLAKKQGFYSKLEIETRHGRHIGWVSCYDTDVNDATVTAVGLNIPAVGDRGQGYGAQALSLYMAHLFEKEATLYTQTWSGNLPMVKLAEKMGFTEVRRIIDHREVRGQKYDALTFAITKEAFFEKWTGKRDAYE